MGKRPIASAGTFTFIGVASGSGPEAKTFVDTTLPAGSDSVAYTITGMRSGVSGTPAEVTVRFGSVGGGGFSLQSISGAKMAA